MNKQPQLPSRPDRRRFLQMIGIAGGVGVLWHLGLGSADPRIHTVRQSRVLMGTQINLIVFGPDPVECDQAVQATFARMDELTTRLSRHNQTSELARLNTRGRLVRPGRDLCRVLELAERISRLSEGAFDVTILPLQELYARAAARNTLPDRDRIAATLRLVDHTMIHFDETAVTLAKKGMAITLDGIAKGYIVDQGIAALRQRNFPNVYVEAGGDLRVAGVKPGNRPWRIGIRNPRPDKANELVTIAMADRAVATSGDYMQPFSADLRNHHIIDPRTGHSPPELASATVTAPTVALADGLATAAMVLGPRRAIAMLEALPDCEGFFIGKDLRRYQTRGFS